MKQQSFLDLPTEKPKKLFHPLKWHGGKHYLAARIIELMPPHLHYVEPFFGGGAVLLGRDPCRNWLEGHPEWTGAAAQRGCSEVVNDVNGELTNFWRVLQDPRLFEEFHRRIEATPFSQLEWNGTVDEDAAVVPRAVQFFIRMRQSRQGIGRDFATLSRNRTRGGRNEQANAWLSCVDGLPAVHQRLKGVVIMCDDALKIIRSQDGGKTLFYCDPPYLHATRSSTGEYAYEMSDEQHRQLLSVLAGIQGTFLLSGYHSPLYDSWAQQEGIGCVEIEIDNKASPARTKEKKIECVWMNYEAIVPTER